MVMGTFHGADVFPLIAPEISRDTAVALTAFARHSGQDMAPAARL